MQIRKFVEENFLVDDQNTGKLVPFKFRDVQNKYYDILVNEYGENLNFDGAREINLKARKEGFTSLWLGIFAAIDLNSKDPCRSLEISYKEDATKQHFRRYKMFVLSAYNPDPSKWDENFDRTIFESITEGHELVLKINKASFYVGTATSRTGERGGTVQKLLFTEPAHYPNTGVINAPEIIDGTASQVPVGRGIIAMETTANGYNHFKRMWDSAVRKDLAYRPRFFGWRCFYTEEEFIKIKAGFTDKSLIQQEYPETAEEAFLTTGRPVFDIVKLREMLKLADKPIMVGDLQDDERSINFVPNQDGVLKIWKNYREEKRYLIASDVAGGVPDQLGVDAVTKSEHRAWSVAAVFDRSSWEVVAEMRVRCDPGLWGRMLCTLGEYYNWSVVAPELNNHGHATIEAMKTKGYPHVLQTTMLWPDEVSRLGFPTTSKTKSLIITALRNAIINRSYKENSPIAIDEMMGAVFDVNGHMVSEGGYLDCIISRAIGLYCLQFLRLDDTYRNCRNEGGQGMVSSIVRRPKGTSRTGYR